MKSGVRDFPQDAMQASDIPFIGGTRRRRRSLVARRSCPQRERMPWNQFPPIETQRQSRANDFEGRCQLHLVLSSISVGYIAVDRNLTILDINSIALEWLELERDENACRYSIEEIFRGPLTKILKDAIESALPAKGEVQCQQWPGCWLEVHIHPSPDGAAVYFQDVTERRNSRLVVARTRALLQASLNALSAQVVILDASGTIVASNEVWQRFAVTHELVREPNTPGLRYHDLYARPLAGCADGHRIAEVLRGLLAGPRRGARLVYPWQRAGQVRWFQLSATRFESEGQAYFVVSNEDVTTTKEAQQALGEVAERLLVLQQEERQRIAQELHDSTAQHLVAIGLNVMGLKARASGEPGSLGILQDIEGSLEEASTELRTFTYLLHPPSLEKVGLNETLHRYLDGFSRRTGLKTKFRASCRADVLPFTLQRSILRIVQEGLANVHRHASASRVFVDLRCMLEQLHLIVSDDGRGIDGNGKADQRPCRPSCAGVGIPGMRARLRQFGGELEIWSGSGGTRLHAMIPLGAASAVPRVVHADLAFRELQCADREISGQTFRTSPDG